MHEALQLVLKGADVVQARVPLAIVPHVNEGKDFAARLSARRPVVIRDQFVFQRGEKTLGDGQSPVRLMLALSISLFDAMVLDSVIVSDVNRLHDHLHKSRDGANAEPATALLNAYDDRLVAMVGAPGGGERRGNASNRPTLATIRSEMLALMNRIDEADVEPTVVQKAAVKRALSDFAGLVARWKALQETELPVLNASLRKAGHLVTIVP